MISGIRPDVRCHDVRLLFVKLKNIGDALLLTPTLTAARRLYPKAEIHVLVRSGTEGILAGCPAIDRLHVTAAPEPERRTAAWRQTIRLLRDLRRVGFDHVFELGDNSRGRWLSWLSGARQCTTNDASKTLSVWWRRSFQVRSQFRWFDRHRVEKDFYTVNDGLPLEGVIPPLIFAAEKTEPCAIKNARDTFVVLHPGTRWQWKHWPEERWIALGRHLQQQHKLRIIVSCGTASEEIALADQICEGLGGDVISTRGQLNWAQLAGLLHQARLFVGVDTAAMHLAAACQCPIVALFGPSRPVQWSPWKARHRLIESPFTPGIGVSEKSIPRDVDPMKSITLADVVNGVDDMVAELDQK
jgi:heptosyltransferase-3